MSGYVPEQSRAYPARHLCFEIPSAIFSAVLAATERVGAAGEPTDWMQLDAAGPGGRVVEFRGVGVLPPLDPQLQSSPFVRIRPDSTVCRPTLLGDFRFKLPGRDWTHNMDMVVEAHTVRSRRTLGGLLGRKAVFLTTYIAPHMEPHKDTFDSAQPDC